VIDLVAVLKASGVPVIEHPGARTRTRPGSFSPRAVMIHHDASPKGPSPGNARFIFEQGRPSEGIPAPLSQLWVCMGCGSHEVGTWHVGAYGRANHGGTGGPWGRISKDSANTLAYGVEVDFTTGEKLDPRLYHSVCVGAAALLNALGAHAADAMPGHKDYAAGRKSDPDWDMSKMRADVAGMQRDPQTPHTREDFLMALTDAEQTEVLSRLRALDAFRDWAFVPDDGSYFPGSKGEITKRVRDIANKLGVLGSTVVADKNAIAEAVQAGVKAALEASDGTGAPDPDAFAQEVLAAVNARLDKAAA